ncbi:hypothetical protein G4G27_11015 [Sphingomonas sp. So64.6b]|uniref:hypothetical protein n=1 Tax=Sphingomonas sp. So64.6b TaxID=2997354 RepID=UPI0016030BE7|nr:hypothetical protein [Sphingomonas sp. So64.6b]QNA84461.1 hypothetical protein G4G27_11015 [Sphingomonas sp. So64.6b]
MPATLKEYPGALATPAQFRELADEYRDAALLLLAASERRRPLSRAPFRLSAIQAIELYLNAYLLAHGHDAAEVRKLQHDLGARTELAAAAGLKLRQKTAEHLKTLHQNREYLVTRYGPELASQTSQINRLTATLDEVGRKVGATFPCKETQQALPRAA